MNAEELKAFVESMGYTHVKVTVFKNGNFQVSYWEPDYKNVRKVQFSIESLPSKFDGSIKAIWLRNAFPSLYSEPEIQFISNQSEAKTNE